MAQAVLVEAKRETIAVIETRAEAQAQARPPTRAEPRVITLLELVAAVAEEANDEREVVATIRHMLESGRVRLVGNFVADAVGCDTDQS